MKNGFFRAASPSRQAAKHAKKNNPIRGSSCSFVVDGLMPKSEDEILLPQERHQNDSFRRVLLLPPLSC